MCSAYPWSPVRKTIHFDFSQDLVQQPLLYQLSRLFDVVINIRAASVTERGGFIALELEGRDEEIEKVLGWLSEREISVVEGLGEAG